MTIKYSPALSDRANWPAMIHASIVMATRAPMCKNGAVACKKIKLIISRVFKQDKCNMYSCTGSEQKSPPMVSQTSVGTVDIAVKVRCTVFWEGSYLVKIYSFAALKYKEFNSGFITVNNESAAGWYQAQFKYLDNWEEDIANAFCGLTIHSS